MMNAGLKISKDDTGFVIRLHVLPRARRCEIAGIHNGALKVKVTAPPVDDAANHAIVQFLSKLLGLSKSSLQILAGSKSRDKILHIKGLSIPDFLARLSLTIT
jgi:uncharacterized protein (TIGR00251 family)